MVGVASPNPVKLKEDPVQEDIQPPDLVGKGRKDSLASGSSPSLELCALFKGLPHSVTHWVTF